MGAVKRIDFQFTPGKHATSTNFRGNKFKRRGAERAVCQSDESEPDEPGDGYKRRKQSFRAAVARVACRRRRALAREASE